MEVLLPCDDAGLEAVKAISREVALLSEAFAQSINSMNTAVAAQLATIEKLAVSLGEVARRAYAGETLEVSGEIHDRLSQLEQAAAGMRHGLDALATGGAPLDYGLLPDCASPPSPPSPGDDLPKAVAAYLAWLTQRLSLAADNTVTTQASLNAKAADVIDQGVAMVYAGILSTASKKAAD